MITDIGIETVITDAFPGGAVGERVLVLVPDHTRRLPLERLLPVLTRTLRGAGQIEVMVALGTHQPEPAEYLAGLAAMCEPVAVTVTNHEWRAERALASIGTIPTGRIEEIAGPVWHASLDTDLDVRIHRSAVSADHIVVIGPTLPHEVAGYSGGSKYPFPGISGPEMIDVMRWLGALSGVMATIGYERTPVRALIEEATSLLVTPVTLVAVITEGGELAEVVAGPSREAWPVSVGLAAERHITWLDEPAERVVSCPLPIYPELWTAAKAVYKLAPAVADGGELIVWSPELREVSRTHGAEIFSVGYHVLDWFLEQWDRFSSVSLAVLAHSTHVKGGGTYDRGIEHPRISVRLAPGIGPDAGERLNLGYTDPAGIDLTRAAAAGALVVPDAGEQLVRVRP